MFRLDPDFSKRGGGVIFYIKDNLIINLIFGVSTIDIEGVWVNVRTSNKTKPLITGCVYRRPKSTPEFDKALRSILQSLSGD